MANLSLSNACGVVYQEKFELSKREMKLIFTIPSAAFFVKDIKTVNHTFQVKFYRFIFSPRRLITLNPVALRLWNSDVASNDFPCFWYVKGLCARECWDWCLLIESSKLSSHRSLLAQTYRFLSLVERLSRCWALFWWRITQPFDYRAAAFLKEGQRLSFMAKFHENLYLSGVGTRYTSYLSLIYCRRLIASVRWAWC